MLPRKLTFGMPPYFDPTRRNMQKKVFLVLFTASVWSLLPGRTLVPVVPVYMEQIVKRSGLACWDVKMRLYQSIVKCRFTELIYV